MQPTAEDLIYAPIEERKSDIFSLNTPLSVVKDKLGLKNIRGNFYVGVEADPAQKTNVGFDEDDNLRGTLYKRPSHLKSFMRLNNHLGTYATKNDIVLQLIFLPKNILKYAGFAPRFRPVTRRV